MTVNDIRAFNVQFGNAARTIDYTDHAGSLLFTFEVADKESRGRLVLEHWAKSTPRDSRYALAFERTKEFLESHGYTVEVWVE